MLRPMRMDTRAALPVGLSLSLLLAGCTGSGAATTPTKALHATPTCAKDARSFGPVTPRPERAEAPLARANVVFKVANSSAQPQVVTVRDAKSTLFSVRLPPESRDACRPVLDRSLFVHPFDLPASAVTLEATANDQRATLNLTPGPRTQWVVVQPQDGFPLHMSVSFDEPQFG